MILDGARARNMTTGAGGPRARTPNLDRLARDGTEFTRAIAPGNWTLPSHRSFLTGTYPWVHLSRTFRPGNTSVDSIASWLSRRGYATGVFTEEVHLIAGYGLEAGYTTRFCPVPAQSDEDRTITNRVFGHSTWLYSEWLRKVMSRVPPVAVGLTIPNFRAEVAFKRMVCNDRTVAAFEQWVGGRDRDRPFHALINFVDPHEPYDLTPNNGRSGILSSYYARIPRFYLLTVDGLQRRVSWPEVEGAYLRTLEAVDAKVGQLVEVLERERELDRTLIVVTSDHGQSFGEGGNVYHGCGATDSVLRVPLVVRGPEGVELPKTVNRWVGLGDLPSWLKGAAQGGEPYDKEGFPLVPFPILPAPAEPVYAEGGPASDPNLSLMGIGGDQRWNHRLIAAYVRGEKYVLDTQAGDIRLWTCSDHTDGDTPQRLSPEETIRVRASVFSIRSDEELRGIAGDATATPRRPLEDRRMRSWGYD